MGDAGSGSALALVDEDAGKRALASDVDANADVDVKTDGKPDGAGKESADNGGTDGKTDGKTAGRGCKVGIGRAFSRHVCWCSSI